MYKKIVGILIYTMFIATSFLPMITINVQADIPTVTTNDATNVEKNSATLNGYLSDDGGENCLVGFDWGESVIYGNSEIVNSSYIYIALDGEGDGNEDFNAEFIGDETGFKSEWEFTPDVSGYLTGVKVHIGDPKGIEYDPNVDIFIDIGDTDESIDGTKVMDNWNPSWFKGWHTIIFDNVYAVSSGQKYHIEFETGTASSPQLDLMVDGSPTTTYRTIYYGYWEQDSYLGNIQYIINEDVDDFIINLNGLSCGTIYHFSAKAINIDGTGYGTDKSFLTKPEDIIDFTTSINSSSQINLNWNNGNGGDGAYIEYAAGSPPSPWNLGNGIKIDADGYISGTSYEHSYLDSGTRYYYKAWAYAEEDGVKSDGTNIYPFGNSQVDDATTPTELIADSNGPYTSVAGVAIDFIGNATGGYLPYSWYWDFDDGETSTIQNPSHIYDQYGEYTVTLTVCDSCSQSDFDSTDVNIVQSLETNIYGPYHGSICNPVQFYGNASGGFPPYTYSWVFGDGNTSIEQNPQHTYFNEGNYTVILTVSDSLNNLYNDSTYANILNLSIGIPVIEKIQGGLGVIIYIKNIGLASANNVSWSIDVEPSIGLILSGEHTENIIDELASGGSDTIHTIGLRGIGRISITVQVADAVKHATGFLLGPLVLRVNEV